MQSNDVYWIGIGDVHESTHRLKDVRGIREAQGVIISGDMTLADGATVAKRVVDAVKEYNPAVLAQIGNMDKAEVDDWLNNEGINLHAQGRELAEGVGIMGVGGSITTPFGTPSEFSDEQIGLWLEQGWQQVKQYKKLLLVVHNPPVGNVCDRLPNGVHVGSPSVRAFIERVQPDVCLTGHIHEAMGTEQIGHTTVINTGAFSSGGYAVIRNESERLVAELVLF
ncbi:metallophosphoesterase [Oleidesulfovibrio sp.]|uniref:metallophosphoesterase n=1 Tax=Oleidesulfovibrio sp. TaxID=2909707 RepID=UPI003A8BB674